VPGVGGEVYPDEAQRISGTPALPPVGRPGYKKLAEKRAFSFYIRFGFNERIIGNQS
jgi:hypothetical protein